MASRAAVRDVGRALGMSYGFCDQVAKLIPFTTEQTRKPILEIMNEAPDLKQLYNTNTDARKLIDAASHLEGVARHASVHACGTVISEKPLTEYTRFSTRLKTIPSSLPNLKEAVEALDF
jgi:DNA polymerase-3 subunit alpha